MFGLTTGLAILLVVCILCACLFEFINGFHDTANAVATVIYTKSLKPTTAVIWSGIVNSLGVFFGGIGVTLGIVSLLPIETLIDSNIYHNLGMVMALLLTAIIWNLATWYVGIPCSSSHTLIGSILGVGLGYSLMYDKADAVNWTKAGEIGTALLVSPLVGFSIAIILMFILRRLLTKKSVIFKETDPEQKPPFWIRFILIATSTLVSFFHGSNDGQKGIGLMMLILIAIVPGYFALNSEKDIKDLKPALVTVHNMVDKIDQKELKGKDTVEFKKMMASISKLDTLVTKTAEQQAETKSKFGYRKHILVIGKCYDNLLKGGHVNLSLENQKILKKEGIGKMKSFTDFAPGWVIALISISLGLGTMIGWKRIVVTIGEKIGKQNITYAQGASAQLVAATTIALAGAYNLPVSTTHVLSSGVAGSMVASKGVKNLQSKTIRNILIAWVLTLPVCMTMAGLLFWIFRMIF